MSFQALNSRHRIPSIEFQASPSYKQRYIGEQLSKMADKREENEEKRREFLKGQWRAA